MVAAAVTGLLADLSPSQVEFYGVNRPGAVVSRGPCAHRRPDEGCIKPGPGARLPRAEQVRYGHQRVPVLVGNARQGPLLELSREKAS